MADKGEPGGSLWVSKAFLGSATIVGVTGLWFVHNLVTLALLPPQERLIYSLSSQKTAADIAQRLVCEKPQGWLPFAGWATALGVLVVGGLVIYVQHGRIKRQGKALSDCRKEREPKRLSSTKQSELLEYTNSTRAAMHETDGEEG